MDEMMDAIRQNVLDVISEQEIDYERTLENNLHLEIMKSGRINIYFGEAHLSPRKTPLARDWEHYIRMNDKDILVRILSAYLHCHDRRLLIPDKHKGKLSRLIKELEVF